MITPSLKIKKRLAKRLSRFGVHSGTVYGEFCFMEPVKMRINTKTGMSMLISTEVPICPFEGQSHYTFPVAGKVSRLAKAYQIKKLTDAALTPSKEALYKAQQASGELEEFLNHIRTPRVAL
jgi:hypothetical protein